MKKATILCIALLVSLLLLLCGVPENPFTNPENASATFKSINNAFPLNINSVNQAETVTIVYTIHYPNLIDSVSLKILSAQQITEARYLFIPPWNKNNDCTADIVFPNSGVKTCLLTCFKSDGSSSEVLLTFSVVPNTVIQQNIAPKWAPDTIEMTTIKGTAESLNLMPYANDPEKKAVSFSVLLPNNLFTSHDSVIISTAALDTGSYPIRVIISDGSFFDTGTVMWKVIPPQTIHAAIKNDYAETAGNTKVVIDVLKNDSIAAGQQLIISAVTQPSHGLSAISSGRINYVPDSGFAGVDTFNYVVNSIDTGKVFVTVLNSAITDTTGPVFKQISGPLSGSVVTSPLVSIVDSIAEPSGIDSVFWRLNNGPIKLLTAVSGKADHYLLTDSLQRTGLDTIVVTAVDKSAKHNRSVQTVVLNYAVSVKIIEDPLSKEANEGGSTSFSVKAAGDKPLSYQWFKNDTAITGTDSSAYSLASIKKTDDKSTFKCVVSNSFSKDTSAPAVLTVIVTPVYKVAFSVDGGTAITEQSVKKGEKVLKPSTNPTKEGYEFSGWYTSPELSTVFDFTVQTIIADVIIYAKWTKIYTLTIANFPTTGGTASKSPATVYPLGTVVTITASANAGYRFKNWSGDYSGTTNPIQITMTKDYTITANFLRQYTVTFNSTPSGRGNVTTPINQSVVVDSGVALDIVATPATGFKFKKWTSSNAGVSFANSTAATTKLNITQNAATVMVEAVFGCNTFRKDLPAGYFPNSVVQADDGSYGVYCHLFTTTGDGVIIKLNANGDSVWNKTVCHLGILDESYPSLPIHKITNGFMAGLKAGSTPIYGISLDANSTPLFAWDPSTDFNLNYSIQYAIQTRDGGYFLSGYYDNQIYYNQMLIKTDAARKKVWMMYTDTLYGVRDCQQTLDNGFIMVDGSSRVIKINNTGTMTNFSIKFTDITPNSVCQISESDGFLIGGDKTYSGAALVKLNSEGDIISGWPKIYNKASTSDAIVTVRVTKDGNFIFLTGVGNLIKTNSSGEIMWEKKLSSGGKWMDICSDGGLIILTDTWVMKTDENGDTD